jgi:hypothetical protein
MKRLVPRPEGVDAKIERAKRHLAVIKREVRVYQGSHPEFAEAKLNPTLPGYDLYAQVRPLRLDRSTSGSVSRSATSYSIFAQRWTT